jgi:hypothetical protein
VPDAIAAKAAATVIRCANTILPVEAAAAAAVAATDIVVALTAMPAHVSLATRRAICFTNKSLFVQQQKKISVDHSSTGVIYVHIYVCPVDLLDSNVARGIGGGCNALGSTGPLRIGQSVGNIGIIRRVVVNDALQFVHGLRAKRR